MVSDSLQEVNRKKLITMQILHSTYFVYQMVAVIVLTVIITGVIVRFTPKDHKFIVGFFGGVILFLFSLKLVDYFDDNYTFRIIRVENDSKHSMIVFIGRNSSNYFTNVPGDKIENGHTYIYNLSNQELVLEPVSYNRTQSFSHGYKSSSFQKISPHCLAKCTNFPDYYFTAPNSIIVKKKRTEPYNYIEIKWLLRYSETNE